MLRELTQLNGVSGYEDEVRDFIKGKIEALTDEIKVDSMGNLIAYKKGTDRSDRKVMLSAHMDEVGLMVTGYDDKGFLHFKAVGGMDDRILPGQRVTVGTNRYPGHIGLKTVHLLDKEERNKGVKLKSLYIDMGAKSREEAEKAAPPGEAVAFCGEYAEMGGGCIKAKALDDRVGCAVLMELLQNRYRFDLYACFTVQEEIGLRGAEIASYGIQPDMAFVIEGTTCSDVPGVQKSDYSTVLGGGAAVTLVDKSSYSDRALVRFIEETARCSHIRMQFKNTVSGGNDAGTIQQTGCGVRTAVLSVPCRYIHSPVSMLNLGDFECVKALAGKVLERLGEEPV